jgi:hypothetical protein
MYEFKGFFYINDQVHGFWSIYNGLKISFKIIDTFPVIYLNDQLFYIVYEPVRK